MSVTRSEFPDATETTQMNETTASTIKIAKTLGGRGFKITSIHIETPDGRTWEVAPVPAGRGRHLDGHWGPRPGALAGFRLFEMDSEDGSPNEHDAVDGDTWTADDLIDYLKAVGQPKARPGTTRTTDPTT